MFNTDPALLKTWTLTADGLPPELEPVLGYYAESSQASKKVGGKTGFFAIVVLVGGGNWLASQDEPPTYWMPLPAPPTGS